MKALAILTIIQLWMRASITNSLCLSQVQHSSRRYKCTQPFPPKGYNSASILICSFKWISSLQIGLIVTLTYDAFITVFLFHLLIDITMNLLLVLMTRTLSITYIDLCAPTIFYSAAFFTPPLRSLFS